MAKVRDYSFEEIGFELQSCNYVHFRTNTLRNGIKFLYPTSYELNNITAVLLRRCFWYQITHEGWYVIKKEQQRTALSDCQFLTIEFIGSSSCICFPGPDSYLQLYHQNHLITSKYIHSHKIAILPYPKKYNCRNIYPKSELISELLSIHIFGYRVSELLRKYFSRFLSDNKICLIFKIKLIKKDQIQFSQTREIWTVR